MVLRVLITGGNGLLGTSLISELLSGRDAEVISVSRSPCANGYLGQFEFHRLDIVDSAALERVMALARPDVVIHTAAMTDVDGCELNPEEAARVNVTGTANLARACRSASVRLVHLSTDYVFDGRAGPYAEEDQVNPLGVYGRTKLCSEQVVAETCLDWAIARTAVLYGYAPHCRPNFITWLVGELQSRRRVRVVRDQEGSPTLAENLAQMLVALALSSEQGIFHTAGATVIDRYSLSLVAAEIFGLDATLITPVDTASLSQRAPRPLRSGLRVDKFRDRFPLVPVLSAVEGLQTLRRRMAASG